VTWWNRLLRRRQVEEDLDRELRFHVEQFTDDLIANGHSRTEARRQARMALGGPEQLKEDCRDARGTRWIEELWQDFRYALRALRHKPGFTAVALLTLALGAGATAMIFTIINSVLLKPLAIAEPDRLVRIHWKSPKGNSNSVSWLDILDIRRDSVALQDVSAMGYNSGTVSEPGPPAYENGREFSSDLLAAMGVKLERGRMFQPDEDRPGGAPVVIIGHSLWQRRFGGSPAAVGSHLVFEGTARTVIGILPADFHIGGEVDVVTPVGQDPLPRMHGRGAGFLVGYARLRPGVTIAQAQGDLARISRHLAAQYPDSNAGREFVAASAREDVVGGVGSTLWLLLGAVGVVLLMASVNVASLLLARAVSRDRETTMRTALGATRGRLARQCLTESALLGLCGGVLGTLLAIFGIRPFVALWPGGLPRAEEVRLDWHVLVFAAAVSLASGLLPGLAPALRVPAHALEQTLREGARSVTGSSRRLHSIFISGQIALAVVLLVSAGLLGRTMLRLSALNPGFNLHNVIAARATISPGVLSDPARMRAAWNDFLGRVPHVAGVQYASLVDTVPMRNGMNSLGYWTSAVLPLVTEQPVAITTCTTPDYLKVMGIPLLRGRYFDEHDHLGTEPVVVIDEVMAQHAFPGQDAVGKSLWVPMMGRGPFRIIGIVSHVRHWGLATDESGTTRDGIYAPFAQQPDSLMRLFSGLMSIVVRTSVPPLTTLEPLRREVRGATGDQVLYDVYTMEQLASDSLSQQRFLLVLFGVFAGLALMLASIGIYGVLAYLTSQRVPEIGVRMALGARGSTVMRMVLGQSFTMVSVGAIAGIAAAVAAGRVLQRLVAGVQGSDPLTVVLMIMVLCAAALAASFIPARRASRVDPMTALRQE
jgi:predicted permease